MIKVTKKAVENANYRTLNVLGYQVFKDELNTIDLKSKNLINTINLNAFVVAEQDKHFKQSLLQSQILLPDGVGMLIASRLLYGKRLKKIAGANLHSFLLEKLNAEKGSCFYLGSSQHTLDKIKARLQQEYPQIRVGFLSPPFKPEFSAEENKEMVDAVNAFEPDVLFVGMTAPKQEKWAYDHQDVLKANLVCSIGAAFDFYAKTIKRPSPFWISLGLEWLVRLLKEPKRMWRRYLYNGPIFFYLIFKLRLKSVFSRPTTF